MGLRCVYPCAFRAGKEVATTKVMDAWVSEPLEREPSPKRPSVPLSSEYTFDVHGIRYSGSMTTLPFSK